MSFFGPSQILYLKPDRLEFYQKNGQNSLLEFPKDIVAFQEIQNSQQFADLLIKFLEPLNLTGKKIILLISEAMLFEKIFPLNADFGEIDQFLSSIPIENKVEIRLQNKREQLISVTNWQVLEKVLRTVEDMGGQIVKAVPATLIEISQNSPLDEDSFAAVLKVGLKKEANFLGQNFALSTVEKKFVENKKQDEDAEQETEPETASSLWKIIFLILMLIILAGGLAYLASTFGVIKLPFGQKVPTVKPSASPTIEASASAQPGASVEASHSAQVKKEELKAQILNGSGVIGQAARVRDILVSLGYLDIETANAVEASEDTKVSYKQNITEDLRVEINAELEKIYSNLVVEDASESAQFDILIITGKLT